MFIYQVSFGGMCHITVINGKSDWKFKKLYKSTEIIEAGKYKIVSEQRLANLWSRLGMNHKAENLI